MLCGLDASDAVAYRLPFEVERLLLVGILVVNDHLESTKVRPFLLGESRDAARFRRSVVEVKTMWVDNVCDDSSPGLAEEDEVGVHGEPAAVGIVVREDESPSLARPVPHAADESGGREPLAGFEGAGQTAILCATK